MKVLKGKGISDGVAIGIPEFLERKRIIKESTSPLIPEKEEGRFKIALRTAVNELTVLADRLRSEEQETAALLMESHIAIAEDPDFSEAVISKLNNNICAEAAVAEAGVDLANVFRDMENLEMRARADDINDVANRVISALTGNQSLPSLKNKSILVADNLTPAELSSLDRTMIQAIVMSEGSLGGHTAILAKSFGIPAVACVGREILSDNNCSRIIVDAISGEVITNPDEQTLKKYEGILEAQEKNISELKKYRGLPNTTADGRSVKLYCNIKSPDEVEMVKTNDGGGIGLFRTEFMFLGRDSAPSEDEQFEAYKRVLSEMGPSEVVIRTLDIGADKKASFLSQSEEENPALGLRGIRLCLENREMFRTQLRAMYRASAFGNMLIMFPMVSNTWEVMEAKSICKEVVFELKSEGVEVAESVPIGIMIETPAAALISDELAKIVDFFSCGTNDLTQYTLACDRNSGNIDKYYDHKHRAVLELLRLTTKNAHKQGIWVGICGEAASDTDLTEVLMDMGIDELSVSPGLVLPVRRKIRSLDA